MSGWFELEQEFERWDDPSRPASMWWRDDDACRESPLLDRALALSETYGVPLGLAVIPAVVTPAFSLSLSLLKPDIEVLQHGFAHRNHAGKNKKKSEFGDGRAMEVMIDEISRGTGILRAAASNRFVPMFVPPWNRVARPLIAALPGLGFHSLSTFGARSSAEPAPGLRQVNTHVDLIDWRGSRRCRGSGLLLAELVAHLEARRSGTDDEPTGILSHHLAHDEDCWKFLDTLFSLTSKQGNVCWLSPSEAVGLA